MPNDIQTVPQKGGIYLTGPLGPEPLKALGVIGDFPAIEPGWDPQDSWSALYRICMVSGRVNRFQQSGLLRLIRHAGTQTREFRLTVDRYMKNETDRCHHHHAEIVCRGDALGSPVSWKLTSSYLTPQGAADPTVSRTTSWKAPGSAGALTTNWGLFEAVQRLPFKTASSLEFTMLETLDLPKENQRLSYRGELMFPADVGPVTLHSFQHLGRGILPMEYFVDEDHRLVACANSSRVYVLESAALMPLPEVLQPVLAKLRSA
jgi:hypothetical protein